ncbi:hypothetical protein BCV71DRAFT_279292 [Rhizopus microsporus]|uniref:Uncharacterized protein n=1 Tax=Rhizopus microsporus TaxID=58291 RepID=A0A1X0RLY9_RHIZD|nr:hypothetical protein BCV71DRAFT_279292 [Rhizopus microsporus]
MCSCIWGCIYFYDDEVKSSNPGEANLLIFKGIQMTLSKKCLVIKIDEYRTSIVCNSCHGELQKIYEPENALICNYRKRKRMLLKERKSRLNCLGSDKKVLCKSSECVERRNPDLESRREYSKKYPFNIDKLYFF